MNVQQTKDRLAGTKVQNLGSQGAYLIDQAENEPFYDEIIADDFPIPSGYLIILKDEDGVLDIRLGNGKVWSETVGVTKSDAAVAQAVADKPEIAALSAASTAAQIVAALKA